MGQSPVESGEPAGSQTYEIAGVEVAVHEGQRIVPAPGGRCQQPLAVRLNGRLVELEITTAHQLQQICDGFVSVLGKPGQVPPRQMGEQIRPAEERPVHVPEICESLGRLDCRHVLKGKTRNITQQEPGIVELGTVTGGDQLCGADRVILHQRVGTTLVGEGRAGRFEDCRGVGV